MRRRIGGEDARAQEEWGQRSLERRQAITIQHILIKYIIMFQINQFFYEKKQCSLFNCSNTITFTVSNVNVFEGPFTLASDGFVYFPLFFHHFGEHI